MNAALPPLAQAQSWLRDARHIHELLAKHAVKDVDHAYYRWLTEQLLAKLAGLDTALQAASTHACAHCVIGAISDSEGGEA